MTARPSLRHHLGNCSAGSSANEVQAFVNPKTYRYLLWPLWFVIVPAALSALTYNLVAPAETVIPITFWDNVQFWVKDQPVPTLIVLFTIFEMVLYSYRHSLPGAQYLGATSAATCPRRCAASTSKPRTCSTRPSASSARTAARSSAR